MPPARADALATLAEGRAALEAAFGALDDDAMHAPATIGGGDWSAKDLLAHLALWERLALEALAQWRDGARPTVEDVFAQGARGVDRLNAEHTALWRDRDPDAVRAEAARAHEALGAAIRAMDDDEWRAKAPYETSRRRTLGELLGAITGAPKRPFGHAFAHLPDLEAYVRPSGPDESRCR